MTSLHPKKFRLLLSQQKAEPKVTNLELFTFFSSAVERLQDYKEEQSMSPQEIQEAREFDREMGFRSEPDERYLQRRDEEMKAEDLAELDALFPGKTPEQIRDEYIAALEKR